MLRSGRPGHLGYARAPAATLPARPRFPMSGRIRHQLSAAVFVVLARGGAVCLMRRVATGWMDGLLSLP